ncbi:hypothetical protein BB560_001776 [Smittium megazygosporum]|uniref:Uncharacterized protein n=1 Tax=Smittium megazygosporum TaxID=133381 RepID=A0A2T9ZGT7_9FUNG|nr:hypothetical protein BB560_001776 [Smittium megazygosporum]
MNMAFPGIQPHLYFLIDSTDLFSSIKLSENIEKDKKSLLTTWNFSFVDPKTSSTFIYDKKSLKPTKTTVNNKTRLRVKKVRLEISPLNFKYFEDQLKIYFDSYVSSTKESKITVELPTNQTPGKLENSSKAGKRLKNLRNLLMSLETDVGWEVHLSGEKKVSPVDIKTKKYNPQAPSNLHLDATFPKKPNDLQRLGLLEHEGNSNMLFIVSSFPDSFSNLKNWIQFDSTDKGDAKLLKPLFYFLSSLVSGGLGKNYENKQTSINWINFSQNDICLTSSNSQSNTNNPFDIEKLICYETAKLCLKSLKGVFLSLPLVLAHSFKNEFDFLISQKDKLNIPLHLQNLCQSLVDPAKNKTFHPNYAMFSKSIVSIISDQILSYKNSIMGTVEFSASFFKNNNPHILNNSFYSQVLNARFFRESSLPPSGTTLVDSKNDLAELVSELIDFKNWYDPNFNSNFTLSNSKISAALELPDYPWSDKYSRLKLLHTPWFVEIGVDPKTRTPALSKHPIIAKLSDFDQMNSVSEFSNEMYIILTPNSSNTFSISVLMAFTDKDLNCLIKTEDQKSTKRELLIPTGEDLPLPNSNIKVLKARYTPFYKPFPLSKSFLKYLFSNYSPFESKNADPENKTTNINNLKSWIDQRVKLVCNHHLNQKSTPNTKSEKEKYNEEQKDTVAFSPETGTEEIVQLPEGHESAIDSRSIFSAQPLFNSKNANQILTLNDWFAFYYADLLKNDRAYYEWNSAFDHLDKLVLLTCSIDEVKESLIIKSDDFEYPYECEPGSIDSFSETGPSIKESRKTFIIGISEEFKTKDNSSLLLSELRSKEYKLQILLHLYVLSYFGAKDISTIDNLVSNRVSDDLLNSVYQDLNYYFDELCILYSLDFNTSSINLNKGDTKDPIEDFLFSDPMMRFKDNLKTIINSLLERNGVLISDPDFEDLGDMFLDPNSRNTFSSSSTNSTAAINNEALDIIDSIGNKGSTKRKGRPKKTETAASNNIEFIYSPKKPRKSEVYEIGNSIDSSVSGNPFSGNSELERVISNKKLARNLPTKLSRFSSVNNFNFVKQNPRESLHRAKSMGSKKLSFLDLINAAKETSVPKNSSSRRSSGSIINHIKQKMKTEVLFNTSKDLSKSRQSSSNLVSLNSADDAKSDLLAKNQPGDQKLQRKGLHSSTNPTSKINVLGTSSMLSRKFSAPAFKTEKLDAQDSFIDRKLRRKERMSGLLLAKRISSSIEKYSESAKTLENREEESDSPILDKKDTPDRETSTIGGFSRHSTSDLNKLFYRASAILKNKEINKIESKVPGSEPSEPNNLCDSGSAL